MTDSALAPGASRRHPRRWLFAIVTVVLAAFALLAGLQWRQYTLLNASLQFESRNIVWVFYQLEVEYLRLRNTLLEIGNPAPIDRDTLQLRYDIFVSRVALIERGLTNSLKTQAMQAETVKGVQNFVTEADVFLGTHAARPFDLDAARYLLARLEPLGGPLHDISQWANNEMSAQTLARGQLVIDRNRISITLLTLLLLLTVLSTAVVVRQFRTLEQRGRALEHQAQRLHKARQDAETSSRAKSTFLANMSHELRTPFQGVLGMLALIEDGPLDDTQRDQLHTARESALHLLSLLNDVLDLSTLEHGNHQPTPAQTDLHRLLAEVEALMGGTARARGLELRIARDANVPAFVLADARRLKQILFNLLGNAVKFTDRGQVLLETSVETGASGGQMLRFTVTDTGIGTDALALERLFQRFSQADESTSRRFGGSGLGLEISRNLARMMNGDIDAASQPGAGSRFTLRIPLLPCDPPGPAAAVANVPRDTRPLRVLVAEDNAINQKFILALLSKLGHRASLRENGELAVHSAAHEDFDLVLMDLHMPVMDGLAATRAIRALPEQRGKVPIFALTADAFPETREKAMQAGMNEFLCKPVQPAELQELLLRRFGPRADSAAAATRLPARDPGPVPAIAHTPPFAGPPVFDPAVLAQLLMVADGSEPEFVLEVLEQFRGDSRETVARCSQALASGDDATVQRSIHTLKSSSAQVGALALSAFAVQLEARLRRGRRLADEDMAELQRQHEVALRAIDVQLGRGRATPGTESRPA